MTAQPLIDRAMSALSARQSASNSPTRRTSAGPTAGGQTPAAPPRDQVLALVAQVFTRLEAIFPRTFSSAFPSADLLTLARRELAQELATWPALPTRVVVERAMSELKRSGSTWPPTIPALVSMLAPRPSDVGLPDVAEAWAEVCAHAHEPRHHRWSHPVVRLAGNAVGWWELRHVAPSRVDRLERRFGREYQALVNRVMAGGEVVERQLLEDDSRRPAAELAERAGREAAQKRAEASGLPHSMTAEQGLRALRAATGRA